MTPGLIILGLVCLAVGAYIGVVGMIERRAALSEEDPAPLLADARQARPPLEIRIHASPAYPPRHHGSLDLSAVPDAEPQERNVDEWIRRMCERAEEDRRERAWRARRHIGGHNGEES